MKIKKISKIEWIKYYWFLLILFFFEPAWFGEFRYVDLFYAGKLLSFGTGVVYLLNSGKSHRYLMRITAYCASLMLSTFLNAGSYRNVIILFITSFGIVSIYVMMLDQDKELVLKALVLVFEFLFYGNFISKKIPKRFMEDGYLKRKIRLPLPYDEIVYKLYMLFRKC